MSVSDLYAGFGDNLISLTSFKFRICDVDSGSDFESKDSITACLLYNFPNPHATIGCTNFSWVKAQCLHLYANSESLSF